MRRKIVGKTKLDIFLENIENNTPIEFDIDKINSGDAFGIIDDPDGEEFVYIYVDTPESYGNDDAGNAILVYNTANKKGSLWNIDNAIDELENYKIRMVENPIKTEIEVEANEGLGDERDEEGIYNPNTHEVVTM
jgi:hypothetical protein